MMGIAIIISKITTHAQSSKCVSCIHACKSPALT